MVIDTILATTSALQQAQMSSFEQDLKPCQHTRALNQIQNAPILAIKSSRWQIIFGYV